MRIAVTGISGFIGSFLARHLKDAGHDVIGLVRATSRRDHIEPYVDRFVEGTHDDETAWKELLYDAEAVIHNSVDWMPLREKDFDAHLKSNLVGSLRFMNASQRDRARQFIFISTIAVHHDMRPRWEGLIDEDHPTRPGMIYGAYKAAVEAHLWAAHFGEGLNFAALRPCGVYGIDPTLDRSHGYSLIEKIKRGEKIAKPGGGKFVHVEDVAAATVACVGSAEANGKVYNLVDCYARWADWAKMACEVLGKEVEIDFSSPAEPKNVFTKDAARKLGVKLDRGHAGIRAHLEELAQRMQ